MFGAFVSTPTYLPVFLMKDIGLDSDFDLRCAKIVGDLSMFGITYWASSGLVKIVLESFHSFKDKLPAHGQRVKSSAARKSPDEAQNKEE